MVTLSESLVQRAKPRARKYEIGCAGVRGFTLRVLPSGRKIYLVRHRPDGRDVRVRIGPADEVAFEDARAQALEILGGKRAAPSPSPQPQPRPRATEPARPRAVTFRELARRYDERHIARNIKPSTASRYRIQLRTHLLPVFAGTPIDAITLQQVEDLHASLRATPGAANNALRLLRHMFVKAIDWGLLPETHPKPTRSIRYFRERKRDRFLTPDERARLEAVLREGEETPPGREGAIRWATAAAIRLLALTGMRRSEVIHLQWSMVDARHRCLRLPDSKTGQKVVPVGKPVIELLQTLEARRRRGVPWVLYSRTGGRIFETSLADSWDRIRKRAGLDEVRLHDLRHSAASDALMAGVPLEVVSKILGHSSTRTTARYAHIANNVVADAVEVMTRSIEAASGRVGCVESPRTRSVRRRTS